MNLAIRAGLVLCSLTLTLCAQTRVPTPFGPQLTQYLELTDDQARNIAELNTSFLRYQSEKIVRMGQVQAELSLETAKTTLDPMALGVRHLELEAIRRDLQAEQQKIATRVRTTLTPAQIAKLQALEQAMRLQPMICQAQMMNLLSQTQSVPTQILPNPFSGNIIPNSLVNISAFLPPNRCGGAIRTGNFTGIALNPLLP